MKFGITLKDIIFTLILGALIFGFAMWQGKDIKIQKAKEETIRKEVERVDALEETVKKIAEEKSFTPPVDPNWIIVKMNVSAYCPCEKCCGIFADDITASGLRIAPGDVFVAAPKKYPFGTEMVIEGYAGGKVVKVEDVGGAIKGNKLDLFFDSHKKALIWGRKQVDVKVRAKS